MAAVVCDLHLTVQKDFIYKNLYKIYVCVNFYLGYYPHTKGTN